MRNRIGIGFLVLLGSTVWLHSARAVSITTTSFSNPTEYDLDNQAFSTYPRTTAQNLVYGVDRGCGDLNFKAHILLNVTLNTHTLNVHLKRDGVEIQQGTAQFGQFAYLDLEVRFDPEPFVPGNWSIEWEFLSNPQQNGAQSIMLLAPIWMTGFSSSSDNMYCMRGQTSIVATFTNGACLYRPAPPLDFIYNNSYYFRPTDTHTCAIGIFDNANCRVMDKPLKGFIFNNRFYKPYDGCIRGTDDSLHCKLGQVPSGSTTSIYHGALYYTPVSGNQCPVPGTWFDNHACYVGQTNTVFEIGGGLYLNYETCKTGIDDGANCLLASAPTGTQAFEFQGGFYITTTKACWFGTFDSANCFVSRPPPGTTAYKQGSDWYWTPRYCQ